jgi:thiol:disulfide interchange protein DsbD
LERYDFPHRGLLTPLEIVRKLQPFVTANYKLDSAFMTSLGIYGPPAILFFDTQGNEIKHRRVVGEMTGENFAAHILGTF